MHVVVDDDDACTSTQKHYTGGFQPHFTGGLENRLRWMPVEIKSFHRRVT